MRGAWWDLTGLPVSRRALLRTPSGKFRFYSTALKGLVEEAVKQEGKKALPPRDPACSGARNQPWLLEQPAVHVDVSWEGWVESAKGRIQLKAKLYAGTLPNVVHITLFGGQGPNPNDLIANEADPFRGFGLFSTTRVRIRKA